MKLPNSQRFLVVYSGVLTAVLAATIFLGTKQPPSRLSKHLSLPP